MSYQKIVFFLLSFIACSSAFSDRGYVGKNPVKGVHVFESSPSCGSSNGSCLFIEFEGGAMGCNPVGNSISISLNQPNIEFIQSMALVSLTSKKKFRTYATLGSCGDATTLNPNGAGVYD